MIRKRWLSLALAVTMIAALLSGTVIVSAQGSEDMTVQTAEADMTFNFKSTAVDGAVNVLSTDIYTAEKGYGFVGKTSAMPSRTVDTSKIVQDENGCSVTETSATTAYTNSNNYNYGGLVFRVDVDSLGEYALTVNATTSSAQIAPNGMQYSRISSSSAWDAAGLVPKQTVAKWSGNTWTFNYVTGVNYIEFEIEPTSKDGGTVGVESIMLTKVANNPAEGKPTVYVLGDSTQKTYTFEEDSMSGYGQVIKNIFDLDKVNVINYSMGGRSMKSSYDEGRFNDILCSAKEGDFVLIHSAHNDESTGDSAGPDARFGRGSNSTTYPKWLDIYCAALEARGITPVLVTANPRTDGGKPKASFNPDSPGFMRKKAAADSKVELVDLFADAVTYLTKLGKSETMDIYQSLEAGESPGKTNSGSYANGHPDNKVDGTHFKEAAAKTFTKLIGDNIVSQSASGSDKIKELASYLKADVQSGNWTAVYPETAAKDVTEASLNGYSASNSKYRNQIEKMLQLGVMFVDDNSLFHPTDSMKTNDFIAALCAIWNLDTNEFAEFYSSGNLTREVMAAIILDAYELRFGKDADGNWNKPVYMTDYNGTNLSPDDPNYDPNLTGASAQYYPLVGWGNITDRGDISKEYLADFHEVYNLGLMRSEKGISRGKMVNGTELQPKTVVTREKAAKELYFLFGLIQNKKTENQEITIPSTYGGTDKNPVVYKAVEYTAPAYEFSSVDINSVGKLSVELKYNGSDVPSNRLVIEVKNADGSLKETKTYSVAGSGAVQEVDVTLTAGESVNMYVTVSEADLTKLSAERNVICTEVILPPKEYKASTAAGIKNGTLSLTNISAETVSPAADVVLAADDEVMWKASGNVNAGVELMPSITAGGGSLTTMTDLTAGSTNATIDGIKFTKYISHASTNGTFSEGTITGTALKFVAPEDGVFSVYCVDVGAGKTLCICEEGTKEVANSLYSHTPSAKSNLKASVPVEAGKTYYAGVLGSKGRFVGAGFMSGAPVVTISAYNGDTVQIDASPAEGYMTESVTVTDGSGNAVPMEKISSDRFTFVMPESDVEINAVFSPGSNYPYEITSAEYDADGKLNVALTSDGTVTAAKLFVGVFDENDEQTLIDCKMFDIAGDEVQNLDFVKPERGVVKLYIWDSAENLIPLSAVKGL